MSAAASCAAPRGVTQLVRGARRALLAARAAESALVGATALFVALWAAVASGAEPERADCWVAAAVCGSLASAAWWRAHRAGIATVARSLDRSFGWQGALVTAFEVERAGRPTRVGLLLSRRIATSVRAREARRALLPRSGLLVALPFLAAALVAQARQGASSRADEAAFAALTGRLRAELAGVGAELAAPRAAGEPLLDEAEQDELYRLARRAAELDSARTGGELDPERAREALAELRDDLLRVEAELPRASGVARRIEAAQSTLDSALLAAGAERARPTPKAGGSQASAASGESGATGAAGAPGGALAPTGPDGTMSGPDRPARAPERREVGTAAGTWWPEEESELVARWIELRRARAADTR